MNAIALSSMKSIRRTVRLTNSRCLNKTLLPKKLPGIVSPVLTVTATCVITACRC